MKIKDICTSVTDGSHNPPQGIEKSEYMMLSSKNIFDDEITFDEPRFLSQKDFEREHKRTKIAVGDVLLTIVGTVGRTAVVDEDMPAFALQRSVAVLHPKNDVCLPRFLMYALRGKRTYIENRAKGVAQKGIYLKEVSDIDIYIPDISNQEIIINKLDKVNAIIKLRQEELLALDDLIKARFVELFGDVKYGAERWGEKPFKDITINLDSKRKPVKEADRKKMQGIYPYYGATGIVDYVNDYRQDGDFLLISEDGKALELRSKPIAFLASGKIWVNNHAHVQQCTDECNMIYLMYHINFMDVSIWVTGIDQKKLNRANLDTIPIALPPIELQEQFADFVHQVDKSKVTVQKAFE